MSGIEADLAAAVPGAAAHHGLAPALRAVPASRRLSLLERMPKWLICVPLTVQWLWLSLRYLSATLPSAANPALTSGGLVGEGKLEYFQSMGLLASAATARYFSVFTDGKPSDAQLRRQMVARSMQFPLIAKPDLGLCGYGVRRIDDLAALQAYLAAFPRNESVVLQQYLPQEGEAGIFYVRDPRTDGARIISLTLRYFPRVTGDGHSTVAELVAADPRARRGALPGRHEVHADLRRVPAAAEVVRLATIGSTRVGGLYRDGAAFITPQLTAAIDAIARDMPQFHFGRFDVRFESLRDLAAGKGFMIMEVNGAGSEAIQAWDPDTGLLAGLRMIFEKQRILFEIGDAMRRKGFKPIGVMALARLNSRQNRLVAQYPPSN